MQALVQLSDLKLLRRAAQRWVEDHPENPNAHNVLDAFHRTNPMGGAGWIMTEQEMERARKERP